MFEIQFPKQSNAADFLATITAMDHGVTPAIPYDLTDVEIKFGLALCSSCGEDYGRSGACAVTGGSETGEVTIDPDPTTGIFEIVIPASDLTNVARGNYRIDVLMKRGGEGPIHLVLGQVEIVASVLQW
jgi:hypothetical protein